MRVMMVMMLLRLKLREAAAIGHALKGRRQLRQQIALRPLGLLGRSLKLIGDVGDDLFEFFRVLSLQLLQIAQELAGTGDRGGSSRNASNAIRA